MRVVSDMKEDREEERDKLVSNLFRMEVFEAQCHLGCVKSGSVGRETPLLLEVIEELTSCDVIHHEIQEIAGLECVMKFHQEGRVQFFWDTASSTTLCLTDLGTRNDERLPHNFHRVRLAACLVFLDMDFIFLCAV